jgi:membrane protease YdiL (CAAX protease family)
MSDIAAPKPALWLRVLQVPIIRLVILGGILFLTMGVSNGFMDWFSDRPSMAIATAAAMAGFALVVYAGFVRLVERRPVSELALPGMGREFGVGVLIGAGLFTLTIIVLSMLGVYRMEGTNPWVFMLPAAAIAISSGVIEELLFRGALFRIVEEWLGSVIALVVSAVVFGLVHLQNPAATVLAVLSISVEAGVLLAAAYMVTRRLWICIGLHMAWNFTESGIFSSTMSGGETNPGLIRSAMDGPDLLTGGSFGPEASVVAVLLCTAAGAMLLVMAIRRGHVRPGSWRLAP